MNGERRRKDRKEEGNGRGGGEVGNVEKRDERERGGKERERERGGESEREIKECTEKLGKFQSFKFNFFKV